MVVSVRSQSRLGKVDLGVFRIHSSKITCWNSVYR